MAQNTNQDLKYILGFIAVLSVVCFIVYSYQYQPTTQEGQSSSSMYADTAVVAAVAEDLEAGKPSTSRPLYILSLFGLFGICAAYYRFAGEIAVGAGGLQWPRVLFFAVIMIAGFRFGSAFDDSIFLVTAFFGSLITILASEGKWFGTLKTVKFEQQKSEIERAFNSKGWATSQQVADALQRATDGVYIGGGFKFNQQGNILTVGGPRGGKGVNLILPALLDMGLIKPDAQSWIILDPKGENCAVAGAYLKWAGYKVHVINPFGIPEIEQFGNAQFNVFDLFNVGTRQFASFVDMVVTSLMPDVPKEDDFFKPYGREVMRFYIGYMMWQNDKPKTFKTLYEWLHLEGKDRDDLLVKMSQCTGLNGVVKAGSMGIIGLLNDDAGKTVSNIYAAAQLGIKVFGDEDLGYSVARSDFNLTTISKEKTAIFICANPRELVRVTAWVRILFNSFIDNMLQGYNAQRKVVVLMDEFHKLGPLDVIKNNISFLPGYNVVFWPVVQSLGQLKQLYPDIWEDFIASATIRQFLSIQDSFTAEYLSKRMPYMVRFVGSHSDGSPKEIRVPLLSMDEVIAFPNILLEMNGLDRPAQFIKKPYWNINEHGAPNPFR